MAENGGTAYGDVENRTWEVLSQVATSGTLQGAVPIKIPAFTLGAHNGAYLGTVAYAYNASTNKATLPAACRHVVLYPTVDMYVVLDSSDASTDLADGTKRIFLAANTPWERSFNAGITVFDFVTTASGVTGEIHVEAYV